jgi:hypothetical protein
MSEPTNKTVYTGLHSIAHAINDLSRGQKKHAYNRHLETVSITDKFAAVVQDPDFRIVLNMYIVEKFIDTPPLDDDKKEEVKEKNPKHPVVEWGKCSVQSDNDDDDILEAEPSKQSYAALARGFSDIHIGPDAGVRNTPAKQQDQKQANENKVVNNYKSDRQRTTTCERYFADYKCPHGDTCWFLHDFDDDGYPINWGFNRGYYTSRKGSSWRHYEEEDYSWVHELSTDGCNWTVKTQDEYIAILKQPSPPRKAQTN